ncbi:MAG: hypothetical protein M1428_04590 [Deltaproteobacteria bacterium]|nr:hypothetical protein [Deltaproteobacteria bacterium]
MKKIKILTIVLLAIGLAGAGIGCGSSSSGSSGNQVSSGVNALPPANLTVQNIGSAASQAISSANQQPPTDVSNITSSTVNSSTNQGIPTLSYLFKNLGNNVVIKPQSMRGTALNALAVIKQAATSGSCAPTSYTDNSTTGNLDVTVTWSKVSCTISTTTMTINGSITITGNYDTTLGTLAITDTMDLNFIMDDPSLSLNENVTLNGSDTITGAGVVAPLTNITYSDKGKVNISATITSQSNTGSFTGWVATDDTFTGTPSQIVFTINDGTEVDSGSAKIGVYATANITMTTSGSPITSLTINGSGTYGVAGSSGTYTYTGKYSVAYAALTFDNSCADPVSGTITITANHVFLLDFNGASCGCASVSEDGTVINANYCTLY